MGRCLAKIAKGFLGCNVVLAGAYDKAIVEYNFLNLKMVRELIVNLILKQVHKASGSTYTWSKESQYNEQGEKNLVACATIGEIANMRTLIFSLLQLDALPFFWSWTKRLWMDSYYRSACGRGERTLRKMGRMKLGLHLEIEARSHPILSLSLSLSHTHTHTHTHTHIHSHTHTLSLILWSQGLHMHTHTHAYTQGHTHAHAYNLSW